MSVDIATGKHFHVGLSSKATPAYLHADREAYWPLLRAS